MDERLNKGQIRPQFRANSNGVKFKPGVISTASIHGDSQPAFDVAGERSVPAFQVETWIKVEILPAGKYLNTRGTRRCQRGKQAHKTGQNDQLAHDDLSSGDRIILLTAAVRERYPFSRRKL